VSVASTVVSILGIQTSSFSTFWQSIIPISSPFRAFPCHSVIGCAFKHHIQRIVYRRILR